MKRRGSLLVASRDNAAFTLRFYPDADETFAPEALCDRELGSIEELGDTLSQMGLLCVPEFLQRVGSPPEVLDFLEVKLSKAELRKHGLLAFDPQYPRPYAILAEPETDGEDAS